MDHRGGAERAGVEHACREFTRVARAGVLNGLSGVLAALTLGGFVTPPLALAGVAQAWLGVGTTRAVFRGRPVSMPARRGAAGVAVVNAVAVGVVLFALPAGDVLAGIMASHGEFAVAISVGTFSLVPAVAAVVSLLAAVSRS